MIILTCLLHTFFSPINIEDALLSQMNSFELDSFVQSYPGNEKTITLEDTPLVYMHIYSNDSEKEYVSPKEGEILFFSKFNKSIQQNILGMSEGEKRTLFFLSSAENPSTLCLDIEILSLSPSEEALQIQEEAFPSILKFHL